MNEARGGHTHQAGAVEGWFGGSGWSARVLSAVICAVVLGVPSEAPSQSLDQLSEDAEQFDEQLDNLEERYLKPALLERKYRLESRFNDGRVAYMLEDYKRASLLLVDLVRSDRFERLDSFRSALYMLGDSLYQRRNYLAAKKYFQRLIDRGPGEYYEEASVRLLEIAAETGNQSGVEALFERLDSQTEVSPSVDYMRGRFLFKQERYEEARTYLSRAAEFEGFEYKARYLRAVTYAAQQNWEEARKAFRSVLALEGASEQQREMQHLAHLGLGRIAYEIGDVQQAIEHYEQLPRGSEHFDRALYELTWSLVSRGKYAEASRNADIFLYLSDPDPSFIPEMRLLKADLALRLDKYDRSESAYQEVLELYQPVRQDMRNFLMTREDVRGYFADLVEQEFQGDDPTYLPDSARKWVDEGERMRKVRLTVEDLSDVRADINEARQALRELEARLESGSRIQSFPRMAEGMAVGIETESQLVRLQEQLLTREFELLEPHLTDAEQERWQELNRELQAFKEKYGSALGDREQVAKREQKIAEKFASLRSNLDEVSYQIDQQQDQLESINQYIRNNLQEISQQRRREIERLRRAVRESIQELEAREEELKNEIAVARQRVGVGDAVTKGEEKLRDKYRKMLIEREQFLEEFHDKAGAEAEADLRQISRARRALRPAADRLDRFFSRMRELVDGKVAELEETIEQERELLDKREKSLVALKSDAKKRATEMAYRRYVQVSREFDSLVLRGDVGLIDVAWQRKEGKTEQIEQVLNERSNRLEELKQSFDEVRE